MNRLQDREVRILCDQNVAAKYTNAFEEADWIIVSTVREELSMDTDDVNISKFAESNGWIILSGDNDFRKLDHDRGFLFYSHTERPPPGDVLEAVRAITDAYTDHRAIDENVPDGWV